MIKRTTVAVLALIIVAGCGGSDEPEKKAAPPPPKVYTAAQLKAALPKVKDVPQGRDATGKCPGDASCVKPKDGVEFSRNFSLKLPFTGAEAEEAAHNGIADYLNLTVTQDATITAATTEFAKVRKSQSAFDGPFDKKAFKTGKGYTFGLRGSGVMADATVAKWPGYELARDITLTNLDGSEEGTVRDYEVRLRRGTVTVHVQLGSGQGDRTLDECEEIARTAVTDYLARLG